MAAGSNKQDLCSNGQRRLREKGVGIRLQVDLATGSSVTTSLSHNSWFLKVRRLISDAVQLQGRPEALSRGMANSTCWGVGTVWCSSHRPARFVWQRDKGSGTTPVVMGSVVHTDYKCL